jgi:hypothetical protein
MLHKINPLLKKTVETTNYTPEQVASVVAHCFSIMKLYIEYPTKAGLRIPYVGVIRTKIKILNHYLRRDGISLLRNKKITKERFQAYWNLRTLIRTDDKRRDHKTRYGRVFNPSWRQSADPIERDSGSY